MELVVTARSEQVNLNQAEQLITTQSSLQVSHHTIFTTVEQLITTQSPRQVSS